SGMRNLHGAAPWPSLYIKRGSPTLGPLQQHPANRITYTQSRVLAINPHAPKYRVKREMQEFASPSTDALPSSRRPQHLMWSKRRLVLHRPALSHPEPQVIMR